MSGPRFGPYGLDAALEVTKQLQQILQAEVVDVDTDEQTTTVFLSIPASAVANMIHARRREWVAFVNENVRRRKAYASGVLSRIGVQRETPRRRGPRRRGLRRVLTTPRLRLRP